MCVVYSTLHTRCIKGLVSWLPFDLGLSFATMLGHDHTLRAMFHPDSLSNSTMVLNWICLVTDGELNIFSALNRWVFTLLFPFFGLRLVGILFSPLVAYLINFQFTPHSKRGRSTINLSLFAGCCFTVSSMVLRNFTLNRITYNAAMPNTFSSR